jgi:hypothetical protein
MDEADAIRMTSFGLAYLLILLSLEYIVALDNGAMGRQSLMAWDIFSLQPAWLYRGWRLKLLDMLFAPRLFRWLMIVRCILAVAIVVYANTPVARLLLALLLGITLLTNLRHVHGRDGADDMTMIILVGLFAYYLVGLDSPYRWIGLLFIVAQLTLSYAVSGWTKLFSRKWRAGLAIRGVMATHIYGKPALLPLLENKRIVLLVSWLTILWESTFPLIWVVRSPWTFVWILGGIAFHVSVAAIMGLNTFLVAFLTTYPILMLWLRCPFLHC